MAQFRHEYPWAWRWLILVTLVCIVTAGRSFGLW